MKSNERGNDWMPPPANSQSNSFDEAGRMFNHMMGEIKRQSKIEHEAERHRSPMLKALGWLFLMSALTAAAIGIYGIYNFPYAPLREKNGAYYGKYDTPVTKTDYERYVVWMPSLFVSFGGTLTLGLTFAALDSRNRRKHNLEP